MNTKTVSDRSGTAEAAGERQVHCPSCGKKGKPVSTVTLRALLKQEFRDLVPDEQAERCQEDATGCRPIAEQTGWRFCDSQECDIVYFAEQGERTFTKSQLKVPVGVKEKSGERPLCYCFDHSIASIKEELRSKGRSDALEDIRRKMKDPGCRCEVTNPSGSCCLGSVARGIEIAKEELGLTETDGPTPPGNSAGRTGNRGEKIAKIGTVVSAIVASSCCWLPLVLLAVGVSGAGIAAALDAYRPVFIVVTFGFLAAAFYFTYRPKKDAAAAGHGCCAPESAEGESCCPPTRSRRFSMMAMNKIMLWVVTVLAVAFLLFPQYVGFLLGTAGGADATVTAGMNRAVLKIDGMTCEGCAATVAQAIRSVPGVLAVEVSYEKSEAVVGTEACCPIPKEKILAALEKAGYSGRFVESQTSESTASGERGSDRSSGDR